MEDIKMGHEYSALYSLLANVLARIIFGNIGEINERLADALLNPYRGWIDQEIERILIEEKAKEKP
jgi:hypothetical protein